MKSCIKKEYDNKSLACVVRVTVVCESEVWEEKNELEKKMMRQEEKRFASLATRRGYLCKTSF